MDPPPTPHISMMLHAHMPYCRKSGRWPAGEEWLFEAMYETYIPLLSVFRRFQRQNLRPRIMMGIVPILAEQLADPYMNDQFCAYMEDKIARARRDQARFGGDTMRKAAAEYWEKAFVHTYGAYKNDFYRDVLGTLKWLQEEGVIECVTSAATHGFLPLMEHDSAIQTQIRLGVKTYETYFGRRPKGFWLPECAYRGREWDSRRHTERRGIDEWLADEKIQYFFVENVGIEGAELIDSPTHEPAPHIYRPYHLESGVVAVGRHPATSKRVWSPEEGYPGHPAYREFHQKDPESGLHYFRVTDRSGGEKAVYAPALAEKAVHQDAEDFVALLASEGAQSAQKMVLAAQPGPPPLVHSQYDAELFGHWWWEGPAWLEQVYLRIIGEHVLTSVSLGDYIGSYGDLLGTIRMQPSTWGENSDFSVWNAPEHAWLWPYINEASRQYREVAQIARNLSLSPGDRGDRLMNQALREKLLLEGSDWPFLLYTQQAKEYSNQRFHHHHQRFNKLVWACKDPADANRLSEGELGHIEDVDNPWPGLDWRQYA